MNFQHRNLAAGRWQKFSLIEQMANVGSEVVRGLDWRNKNEKDSRIAFERALELLDLTITDPKNKNRVMEVARVREALCDYFLNDNQYHSSSENWRNYFYSFGYAVALKHAKI